MNHCHICYSSRVDDDFICDVCDNYYCEDCSYTFTLHYQHQGPRCHFCSDQNRLKLLTKEMIRDNKIKLLINE
jgi:hypothetical protein